MPNGIAAGLSAQNLMRPLAIDLYCGLGGWAAGFLSEGYDIIGFDIKRHDYGTGSYPGQLVLQDVTTLHGSQFHKATVIVASPPCQAYSYRAMPWKRARALPPPDNSLFDSCFRIQREASEAAGRHIPMVVENVCGAQKWVGPAKWHSGSFYFWGDVPALMPFARAAKVPGQDWNRWARTGQPSPHWRLQSDLVKQHGSGHLWFDTGLCRLSSQSIRRQAASARIALIPFVVSKHIARCFCPEPILRTS